MAYFQYFPQTTFLNQSIVNLATSFKLNNMIKEGTIDLLNHVIDDTDKPEVVNMNKLLNSSGEELGPEPESKEDN